MKSCQSAGAKIAYFGHSAHGLYFLYHVTGKAGNAAIESILGKRCVLKNSSSYNCQVKLHSEYLVGGSFLVKLQASSLTSKKITKIKHERSLVINLFWWLTIQTTFKVDSIPCNCGCILKTFSKQYRLDYYTKGKKCSPFTETYRVFRERQIRVSQHISATTVNEWNRDVCPNGMDLIFWRPCSLSFQYFWTERFNFFMMPN